MMPLRHDTIWQFAQNKPSLVANDLEKLGVPRAVTHRVLLARGVYKWLAARRQIIALKDMWRDEINRTLAAIRDAKAGRDRDALMYYRGYLKALEKCRTDVRAVCHGSRWQAPDNDREAVAFLESCSEAPVPELGY